MMGNNVGIMKINSDEEFDNFMDTFIVTLDGVDYPVIEANEIFIGRNRYIQYRL